MSLVCYIRQLQTNLSKDNHCEAGKEGRKEGSKEGRKQGSKEARKKGGKKRNDDEFHLFHCSLSFFVFLHEVLKLMPNKFLSFCLLACFVSETVE